MARRWPVLHLANEKSVPFDVAPARAWWESLLPSSASPVPLAERVPLALHAGIAVSPSPARSARSGLFPSFLARYIFSICHFDNRQGRLRAKSIGPPGCVRSRNGSLHEKFGWILESFFLRRIQWDWVNYSPNKYQRRCDPVFALLRESLVGKVVWAFLCVRRKRDSGNGIVRCFRTYFLEQILPRLSVIRVGIKPAKYLVEHLNILRWYSPSWVNKRKWCVVRVLLKWSFPQIYCMIHCFRQQRQIPSMKRMKSWKSELADMIFESRLKNWNV